MKNLTDQQNEALKSFTLALFAYADICLQHNAVNGITEYAGVLYADQVEGADGILKACQQAGELAHYQRAVLAKEVRAAARELEVARVRRDLARSLIDNILQVVVKG